MGSAEEARRGVAPALAALLVALALVAGALAGHLLLGGVIDGLLGATPLAAPKVALTEGQLDEAVATYRLGGETYEVTYREAIMENGSLEAVRNADGTYRMPSADSVLAYARSQVMVAEAARLGIEVGDAEVDAYALATFGTTDLGTIAFAYGMEEDAAAVLLREAALMSALRDQALVAEAGEPPVAPEEPGEGEEVTLLPKYAEYIRGLAGDEWDADADAWASTDGPYASALADYEISSAGASHEAALQAYYVAYQRHVAALSEANAAWTDYVNNLLGEASITIGTLAI